MGWNMPNEKKPSSGMWVGVWGGFFWRLTQVKALATPLTVSLATVTDVLYCTWPVVGPNGKQNVAAQSEPSITPHLSSTQLSSYTY